MKAKKQNKNSAFEKFASAVCKATGSTPAFIIAFLTVVVWAVSGPFFGYSETWQLVINTGTTIITFLMVFLIQKAQNKDSLAIQLKLNELVASNELSSNSLVDIESMTEEEMEIIKKYYHRLSELAKKDETIRQSHSIAEADESHERKDKNRNQFKAASKTAKKPKTTTTPKTGKK
ncbi:low affinity iron permease family protein [Flavobacterium daemonense]|uniref:low affinity iron permease family protein n=1 Tax=Flavobacterium daemonense TaxID=1393049 RepID=UPI0011859140|nr:low affinity iron permease family protein [Flavobacterium daemonense]KAF2329875.1 low affinity iron permease family protein [Flavobacterium daemonense]